MNNFYVLLQVSEPSLIQNQSNEVRLIYFFGSVIVLGLIAALGYFRSEIKRQDEVIKEKRQEIRRITLEAHESEKENLVVLKDLVDLLDVNADTLKELKELITTTTNPNIKEILNSFKN